MDIFNAYLNLIKKQSKFKIFTVDIYVFTLFSNNRNKTTINKK